MKRFCLIGGLCVFLVLLVASPASAAFGLKNIEVAFENEDGSPARQAGSHPYSMSTGFEVESSETPAGQVPEGEIRNLVIAQIPGFVGNQTAVPTCEQAEFNHRVLGSPACPDASAVGYAAVAANFDPLPPSALGTYFHIPLYSLTPPPGVPAELGFLVDNVAITIDVDVSDAPPYNLVAKLTNVPQAVSLFASKVVLWGNPASPAHDSLRGKCMGEIGVNTVFPVSKGNCPVDAPEVPFITLPRSCGQLATTAFEATSWLGDLDRGDSSPSSLTGCGRLGFDPTIAAKPTEPHGESATGLNFDLDTDVSGLLDPNGNSDSDIEKVVATLPEGVTTNPAVANGLQACSESQYNNEALVFDPSQGCPGSSKVGSVLVESPLVDEALPGSIYIAKQHENPFGSLLALYMVIRSPQLGILIKQAGVVEPDPRTGQLKTTFEGLPQLPFQRFHLHFREGPRAPLITPATCGSFSTLAELFPYANPTEPVQREATFSVDSACAASAAQLPNSASISAGTVNAAAGAYSPFTLRIAREDGTQQISSVSTTLPKGLLGKLAGIPYCGEGAIAHASAMSGEGQGAAEIASPSCPQASQVGSVQVAAGAGPEPLYVSGKAYLAGPYKGAPLSLEIITPAIAGPFDLGVVAVRTALAVDPVTAQITATSDPIPSILHGLPLDVRSIAVNVDRPQFTLNPTSCEPESIDGSTTSPFGGTTLRQYFQASECGKLKFKPRLALTLKGPKRRTGHPALKAVLTYPQGSYANIARASVGLPHSEFLDQSNIGTVCTQAQLKSATCPKKSIYGHAKAWSPLLDQPLEGPVYLGVGYGHKLPDLVADLSGQIRVLLNGKIDSDPAGGIRSTFETVPDAPVSRFVLEMRGGSKGLLENSENVCHLVQKATVNLKAQNGRSYGFKQRISNGCGKRKDKAQKHKGKGQKRKKA